MRNVTVEFQGQTFQGITVGRDSKETRTAVLFVKDNTDTVEWFANGDVK